MLLAVCNVVGAVGLLGLISYGFFSDRVQTTAAGDALTAEATPVAVSIESTRPAIDPVAPSIAISPNVAVASFGPSIGQHSADRQSASVSEPSPAVTGSVRSNADMRQPAPEDSVFLRASLVDDFSGAGLIGDSGALSGDLRRVVVGDGVLQPGLEAPVRLASIGPVTDILPTRGSGMAGGADAENLSFGSLFREPAATVRGTGFDGIPAPDQVPLVSRGDGGAVLTLSFAMPPFQVRDIDPESRSDLLEAEEVARKAIQEKEFSRDRRLARERYCLAAAIYYEARGEPLNGQRAVAQVVLNRVEDVRYPGTICGVVFQGEDRRHRCQFSFACDGKPERPRPGAAWTQSLEIAGEFIGGYTYEPVATATHYHADYVRPRWSRSNAMTRIEKIGNHIFYFES